MATIKIPKEIMLDILNEDTDEGKLVRDEIVDTTRWSTIHEIIFLYQGKHYEAGYSRGSTEQQDERPWEYEQEVECVEVELREVTIKQWVAV